MPYKINEKVIDRVLLHYVPHGIDSNSFKPIPENDNKLLQFKKKVFNNREFNFVILYNSRNINRKRTSNIILAYREFCDNLTKEQSEKCVLILHTEIMQDAGTNLIAVKEALCPDYNIIFSPGKFSPEDMVLLYNVCDILVNASSSEGFGLSCAEAIMCGKPVIVSITGGLQDQVNQIMDDGKPIEFNADFGSNNIGKYKNVGPWVYPLWPVSRLVQGSIPTPYIFDDITRWEDIADGYMYWYMMDKEKRIKCGLEGRRWAMNEGGINSNNMGNEFIKTMEFIFDHWQKPKTFDVYTINDYVGNSMKDNHLGFEIPTIDKQHLQEKINSVKI